MPFKFSTVRGVVSAAGAFAALLALGSSCSRQTVTVQLHPLRGSGDVTYVCRNPDGSGRPLADCNEKAIERGDVDLYALVTQTATGEVAVFNVPTLPSKPREDEHIIDVDPGVPGYGFLHVGASPSRIVSTPGGSLSLVGVREPGKPGIFALPTQCIGAPAPGEPDRDLTTWPACHLPAAPGSVAVVLAPASKTLCDGSEAREQDEGAFCRADVNGESGPAGRRKIIVSLPERGSIGVIDAEWLARGKPGSFEECLLEAELPLSAALPADAPPQILPPDVAGQAACFPSGATSSANTAAATYHSRPAAFALDGSTLYVADTEAPVVHVVDLSDPCSPEEKPPLLTRSLDRPERVVTTSRVAVSPLTPSGRQFVYAIDQYDTPAASVMAFDVSPGATDRTPIVRPGASLLPSEAADRIQFAAAPRDLAFIKRDRPVVDPVTGNVVEGLACDPTPENSGAGTAYRSKPEYTSGARAGELRGVFATVLLTNGQVAIIDVEDFDAPCRRPASTNPDPEKEDFRGCKGDPELSTPDERFVDASGFRTVTDEVSCRMVQPHRARASALGVTDPVRGVHAPSLRGFPQLKTPDSAQLLSVLDKPKLLAVDFELPAESGAPSKQPAMVYVGTVPYGTDGELFRDNLLDVAPATAQRNSVVLPFNEPRAYPANDTLNLNYEGALTDTNPAGFLRVGAANQPFGDPEAFTLNDPSIGFCDRGVHDEDLMAQTAMERFGLTEAKAKEFAETHADYIILTGQFPKADDSFWDDAPADCGRDACIQTFGDYDPKVTSKEPAESRSFHIIHAQQQWLELRPRDPAANREELVAKAQCCFPSGAPYVVRASKQWILRGSSSGLRHKVRPVWDSTTQQLRCEFDCDPRRAYFESRVFEICGSDTGNCASDDVCRIASSNDGVLADDPGERCIYHSPLARFALYRGVAPSVRDMSFSWQTSGGFTSMRLDFSTLSTQTSPNTLFGLPELNWLTVVDGSSLGLVLLSLDTLTPLAPALN